MTTMQEDKESQPTHDPPTNPLAPASSPHGSDSSPTLPEITDPHALLICGSVPPSLHFTLHKPRRERYIGIFFALIFVESGILPLVLFYSLEWGAHLSMQANLAIITSFVGTVSGLKLAQRTYVLWFKEGFESRRPIGGGRWGVDTFHVWIGCALSAFFIPLIVGSALTPANVPAVSMALPLFMLWFCVPLAITGIWDRRIRLPFHVSSLPAYQPLPPLTYTMVEDVVAVDGGGRLAFRQAWRHRYEASLVMRRILRVTAIVWGVSGCVLAGGLIAIAWTAPLNTAYGLGYGMPWMWVFIVAAWSVYYVHGQLIVEKREWESGSCRKLVVLQVNEKEIDKEVDRLQMMRDLGVRIDTADLERIVREGRTRDASNAASRISLSLPFRKKRGDSGSESTARLETQTEKSTEAQQRSSCIAEEGQDISGERSSSEPSQESR